MNIASVYLRDMLIGEAGVAALVGTRVYDGVAERGYDLPCIIIMARPGEVGPVAGLTEAPLQDVAFNLDCLAVDEAGAWVLYGAVHDGIMSDDQRAVSGEVLSGIRQTGGPQLYGDDETGDKFVRLTVRFAMDV